MALRTLTPHFHNFTELCRPLLDFRNWQTWTFIFWWSKVARTMIEMFLELSGVVWWMWKSRSTVEDVAEEMMKEWIHHLRPLKRTRTWLSRTRSSLPHLPLAASPLLLLADCRRRAIFRCTLFHVFPHTDGRGSSAALSVVGYRGDKSCLLNSSDRCRPSALRTHTHTGVHSNVIHYWFSWRIL